MNFSVVIPVLNEINYLPLLLRDISQQTLRPKQIIVADCGSTDGTIEFINSEHKDIRIVTSKKAQPSSARNAGAKEVTQPVILFLDADIRIGKNMFELLLNHHTDSKSDITSPKFKSDKKSISGAIHIAFVNKWLWLSRRFRPMGIGGSICINTTAYKKLGGFDELVSGEDVNLFKKAKNNKLNFGYCKESVCEISSRRVRGLRLARVFYEDIIILNSRKPKRKYGPYN